ncbi:hypothetical protein [Leadbetterella byssophila]
MKELSSERTRTGQTKGGLRLVGVYGNIIPAQRIDPLDPFKK